MHHGLFLHLEGVLKPLHRSKCCLAIQLVKRLECECQLLAGPVGKGFVHALSLPHHPCDLVQPFLHQDRSQICSGLGIGSPLHAGCFDSQLERV
jgi:hypothetical protein